MDERGWRDSLEITLSRSRGLGPQGKSVHTEVPNRDRIEPELLVLGEGVGDTRVAAMIIVKPAGDDVLRVSS